MKAYAGEFLVVKVAFTRYSIPNTLTPFHKRKKNRTKSRLFCNLLPFLRLSKKLSL